MAIHKHDNQTTLDDFSVATDRKVGTFTSPGFTGNFSVTGVGFQPTLLQIHYLSANDTTDAIGGYGATDGGSTWCSYVYTAETNSSTSDIIGLVDNSTTNQIVASFVSFDSDGFTLNFSTTTMTGDFGYVAMKI